MEPLFVTGSFGRGFDSRRLHQHSAPLYRSTIQGTEHDLCKRIAPLSLKAYIPELRGLIF